MQAQGWRGRILSTASLSLKYGVVPYNQALIVAQKQLEGPDDGGGATLRKMKEGLASIRGAGLVAPKEGG